MVAESLATGEALPDSKGAEIEVDVDEEVESVIEVGVGLEDEREDSTVITKHCQRTRSGREVKKPRREKNSNNFIETLFKASFIN
ncbi:hypothetical protein FOXYSP1_19598 [Fusarium oxysporum f. sp. phaseoli]